MIDKKIEKSLSNKVTIVDIMNELDKMSNNMNKVISKTINEGFEVNIEHFNDVDFDDINPIRVRYVVHYIRHCKKRRIDLIWLLKKAMKLKKNNHEMFKLLKFKEKITNVE